MNIFDVVESDLREQIVVLESDNKVLKSEIIRLEKEKRELEDEIKLIKDKCIDCFMDVPYEGLLWERDEKINKLEKENKMLRREFDILHGKDDK